MGPHVGCTCSVYRPVSQEWIDTGVSFTRIIREIKVQGACLAILLAVIGLVHFL